MPTLPLLKSGQIAQYPFKVSLKSNVETVEFLDGSEQRCAITRPLHEWQISFGLIDEQELNGLECFVKQEQGQTGQIQFKDPVEGVQYDNCSIALDVLRETYHAPGRAMATLVIRENPS